MNKKVLAIVVIMAIIGLFMIFNQPTEATSTNSQSVFGKIKTAGQAILLPKNTTTDPYTPNGNNK